MNSMITKNSSELNGGGIAFNGGGTLTVTNSVISYNSSGQGGGIHTQTPTIIVSNSTISGNMANGEGGGILNYDGATITNSTISDNLVDGGIGEGGGIENDGD